MDSQTPPSTDHIEYFPIRGISVSGRTWKEQVLPARAKNLLKSTKKDWLKQQQRRKRMKLINLESKQLINNRKEEMKLKRQKRLEKQSRKMENEIRAAGPNAILLSNKTVSKMSKKAKKKLLNMTPDLINKLKNKRT